MEKIKVLIADDNNEICQMIKNKLEQYDEIEVLAICNSDLQELFLIETLKPDIVITDIVRNGGESGLEIIKKIKSTGKSPRFLVISAADYNAEYTTIIDGFIKKPIIDMEVIYRKLKSI